MDGWMERQLTFFTSAAPAGKEKESSYELKVTMKGQKIDRSIFSVVNGLYSKGQQYKEWHLLNNINFIITIICYLTLNFNTTI